MPITSVTRSLDADNLIDGARLQLLANSYITTTLATATNPKRIANEIVEEGTLPPYIVLALASTVYESSYSEAAINTLLDVSCYTEGASTAIVRALIAACVTALVDTAWTAAGLTIWSVSLDESGTGIRNVTAVTNGVITRGRQATLRVRAAKT